ncbi:MAG: hypothetical protein JXR37_28780 [Kiritimatiellae bacterium]|nr:hypothetical protein [Kiritimatiellia bacterium]
MLPTVEFCGLTVSRLIIGANPFSGCSHQNRDRDRAMYDYNTVDRIHETWARAEAAGINTMVTNNETPKVVQAVRDYLGAGGRLQWIAQVAMHKSNDMIKEIETVVEIGCRALFIHGGWIDDCHAKRDEASVRKWIERGQSLGVPTGVAGHSPEAHRWVYGMNAADFHVVCFYRCGSLHRGGGLGFRLQDAPPATACIREIAKPCIGYKIMAAGRIDARMAFDYAFASIKPTDVVNVGMHRGDNDNMVEENVEIVNRILTA